MKAYGSDINPEPAFVMTYPTITSSRIFYGNKSKDTELTTHQPDTNLIFNLVRLSQKDLYSKQLMLIKGKLRFNVMLMANQIISFK